jgi:hypothetical protein
MSRAKKDKAARDRAANTPPKPPQYCNFHVCRWQREKWREGRHNIDEFCKDIDHAVEDAGEDFWEITRIKE